MKKKSRCQLFSSFRHSRRALAIPMTFLILFVSTLGLISVTYYFAIGKVNAQSQLLKITTAKQDFLSFNENLMSVVSQPGSARKVELSDSSGILNVQPSNNSLAISLSDDQGDQSYSVYNPVYNETIGQITYELPYAETADTGLFLKGDSRTITNQSSSLMTQLFIESGAEHPEIRLRYRPTVTYTTGGTEGDKPINNLRIYVINLNSSDSVSLYGKIPLKISCISTQMTTLTYSLAYQPDFLQITSVLNGISGQVTIPISSTASGAIINLQIVECNIQIVRCVM